MNILYITQLLPYPTDSGGKIKTHSTLKALAAKHAVTLVSFVSDKREARVAATLQKRLRLKSVHTIFNPLVVEKNLEQQLWVMAKSLFTLKPYALYKFWNGEMEALIQKLSLEQPFDRIWFDHLNMTQYGSQHSNVPRVLENHNVEHVLFLRHGSHESKLFWKAFFYLESAKYWWYERTTLGTFQTICAISQVDKNLLTPLVDSQKTKLFVLPPAVSPEYLALRPKPRPQTLLFTGLLTWYPNRQGVLWFVQKVLPLVRRRFSSVRCVFVGDKTRRFPVSQDKHVIFTGRVQSVRAHFQRATIFIAPILFGSGVRIKILEAMASGLPVVSTRVGAEGIGAINHKEFLLADSPELFADSICQLLENESLRTTIGSSARAFVRSRYIQKNVSSIIHKILTEHPS